MVSAAAQTGEQQADLAPDRDRGGRFVKGHSGNANGRPKGAKGVTVRVREAVRESIWRLGGEAFIDETLRKNPIEALKLWAGLEPKDVSLSIEQRPPLVVISEPMLPGDVLPALPTLDAEGAPIETEGAE